MGFSDFAGHGTRCEDDDSCMLQDGRMRVMRDDKQLDNNYKRDFTSFFTLKQLAGDSPAAGNFGVLYCS